MLEYLVRTSQKPRPLPSGHWRMKQRWNDLLFAHWPVQASSLASLVPEGLLVDSFNGSAWLGIMPFWMDRIKVRGIPTIPGVRCFPDLSLCTYVHEERSGTPGVFCLSLDASNLLAVGVGRSFYHLPYHWAQMHMDQRSEREFSFFSRRRLSGQPVIFKARYRGLGPSRRLMECGAGSLEYFLMERYCLFSRNPDGLPIRANLHHVSSQLEEAEADIEQNNLAEVLGIHLPEQAPVLHYSRRLAVYVWPAELVRPTMVARSVTVAATPSG
ncbi:MAG TPA: DUF2071 domain-containing protein [Terracidiphilus sp.]